MLTPKELVHVIRGASGKHDTLEMLDDDDAAGTAGCPTFRRAPLAAGIAESREKP